MPQGQLEDALRAVVAGGSPRDLRSCRTAGTSQFADAIIERLAAPTAGAACT